MLKKTMIKTFKKKDQLSEYFAEMLIDGVSQTPDGEYFSISLSGGSTPRAIFEYLAENFKETIAWEKVLVFWGDERCVAPDSNESNYKMASESLLNQVPIPEKNIFRIQGENHPSDEAKRYGELIRNTLGSEVDVPQFDLILLGLGTDGHTASIFPDSQHLFESTELCAVATHPETSQERITITGKIINHARTVVFLVTGGAKADKVAAIVEQKEGWKQYPASHVHPENGAILWLLDESAASLLEN